MIGNAHAVLGHFPEILGFRKHDSLKRALFKNRERTYSSMSCPSLEDSEIVPRCKYGDTEHYRNNLPRLHQLDIRIHSFFPGEICQDPFARASPHHFSKRRIGSELRYRVRDL